MAYNVFPIDFGDSNATGAGRMMQWDKGQIFKFVDASLEGCEVQFDDGTVKVITNGCISVPDAILEEDGTHSAWVQIIGTDNETTIKTIYYTVGARAQKDDYVTPEDEQTFREWVEESMEETKEIAQSVRDDADEGKFNGKDGEDGDDGNDGNGISSAVLNANYTLTLSFTNGTTYTTPSIRGAQGEPGSDGDDYVITEADYDEIAERVEAEYVTDLNATKRKVDILYKLNEGITYDYESDSASAYTKTVPSGAVVGEVEEFGGKSVVWNQLTPYNGYHIVTEQTQGITYTPNYDESGNLINLTVSGTATANGSYYLQAYATALDPFDNHVIYCNIGDGSSSNVFIYLDGYGASFYSGMNVQKVAYVQGTRKIRFYVKNGQTVNKTFDVRMFDLTKMFGVTEVSAVTDEMKQFCNSYATAHPSYNAGEILHALTDKVVAKGANLWDEQWEIGSINLQTGVPFAYTSVYRSVNFVTVSPNTTYSIIAPNVNHYVFFYRSNGEFISSIGTAVALLTFTTPNGAEKLKIIVGQSSYGNDVAIVKGTSGSYVPYHEPLELTIPTSITSLTGYGWGISDSVRNYVDFAEGKYHQMVGKVDLGTLTWNYSTMFYCVMAGVKTGIDYIPYLMPKYSRAQRIGSSSVNDGEYGTGTSGGKVNSTFAIKDSAYTDAASFKASLNGVYLFYELSTPIVTDITDLLTDFDVEAGGTITFHQQTTELPIPNKVEYLVSLREA